MNRLFAGVLLLLTVCVAPSLPAQTDDDVIQLTRSVIETERQALIAANLGLSEAESAVFWPLYKEYRADLDRAANTRIALLQKFFADYETLTDDEASALLDDFLSYEKERLKTRTKYAKRMSKVLSGRTVARFFQIENKMDAIIEYELAGEIPLIK